MLFDLQSPRRKRVVQVVFGGLAVIFAVSFVFLGIGTGHQRQPARGDRHRRRRRPRRAVPGPDRRAAGEGRREPGRQGGADRADQPSLPGGEPEVRARRGDGRDLAHARGRGGARARRRHLGPVPEGGRQAARQLGRPDRRPGLQRPRAGPAPAGRRRKRPGRPRHGRRVADQLGQRGQRPARRRGRGLPDPEGAGRGVLLLRRRHRQGPAGRGRRDRRGAGRPGRCASAAPRRRREAGRPAEPADRGLPQAARQGHAGRPGCRLDRGAPGRPRGRSARRRRRRRARRRRPRHPVAAPPRLRFPFLYCAARAVSSAGRAGDS